jgi:hypothetical protein
MQAMGGIFLDEICTEMGSSIANLAWHQIRESKRRGLEVWGWSNCNIPGKGYTEGGFLPWWIVTPHASALVIEYYPHHVTANLRKLESMGLRKPLKDQTSTYGFRDAVDIRTGKLDDRYLCLDQAMLFLSVVNYLKNSMIRKHFSKDPLIKNGIKLLGQRITQNPELLTKWAERDTSHPEPVFSKPISKEDIILNLSSANKFKISTKIWNTGKINTVITEKGLEIDYDLGPDGNGELDTKIEFPVIDARNISDIRITCSVISEQEIGGIRLYLSDDQGQTQYSYLTGIQSQKKELIINESERFGIFAKPQAVNSIIIKFWGIPWYYTDQRTKAQAGRLIIEKIIFENRFFNYEL